MDEPWGSKRRHVLWKNVGTVVHEILETSGGNLDLFPLHVVSLSVTEASKMIVQVELGFQAALATGLWNSDGWSRVPSW